MSEKTTDKAWKKRLANALGVIEKSAKKQKFQCSHTVDGKPLKKNMVVFVLDDPTKAWTIIAIDKEIAISKRTVTLSRKGDEDIKRHPTKLFVSELTAITASIKDIKNSKRVILREMNEQLQRLDAENRIKKLTKLKARITK